MKIAGLIGGTGPESTIDYYKAIFELFRAKTADTAYPSLVITSVDMKKLVAMITSGRLEEMSLFLVNEFGRLARAGADFGLLTANTPHIVFDQLRQKSPIPLISIIDVTCREAQKQNLKRVGLIGTQFTMQARFYPDVFTQAGIPLVVPTNSEQEYIHGVYMGELVNGIFRDETRDGLLAIVQRLIKDEAIDGLILGGTELPLILRDIERPPVPFLDTAKLHVEAVVAELLS